MSVVALWTKRRGEHGGAAARAMEVLHTFTRVHAVELEFQITFGLAVVLCGYSFRARTVFFGGGSFVVAELSKTGGSGVPALRRRLSPKRARVSVRIAHCTSGGVNALLPSRPACRSVRLHAPSDAPKVPVHIQTQGNMTQHTRAHRAHLPDLARAVSAIAIVSCSCGARTSHRNDVPLPATPAATQRNSGGYRALIHTRPRHAARAPPHRRRSALARTRAVVKR